MRNPILMLTLTLALALVACGNGEEPTAPDAGGPEGPGETALVAGETPEETFAAFRAATLRQDWNALYELNAPSERAESEARWEKAKHDPANEEVFVTIATDMKMGLEQLRSLSLRDYSMHKNAMSVAGHSSPLLRMAHEAEFVRAEPVEDKDDVVMVTFKFGENEPEMPMKREDGRWYIWKILTAMSSF